MMGRDRQYADNAERQRAYRKRKAAEKAWLREELQRLRREGAAKAKATKRKVVSVKLIKVLGLLGSDYAGERDNAARKASQILKEAGLTWYDVLDVEEDKKK